MFPFLLNNISRFIFMFRLGRNLIHIKKTKYKKDNVLYIKILYDVQLFNFLKNHYYKNNYIIKI